jgi:DNA-binding NarL/FixJ family response regulator
VDQAAVTSLTFDRPPASRRSPLACSIDHVRASDPAPARRSSLRKLTERERGVAVADGLSNSEIAEQLYLSVGSVKAHISNALAKLGIDNRVQLAIVAHESRTAPE